MDEELERLARLEVAERARELSRLADTLEEDLERSEPSETEKPAPAKD